MRVRLYGAAAVPVIAAVLLAGFPAPAAGHDAVDPSGVPCRIPVPLDRPAGGPAAVTALAGRLPAVAAANDTSTDRLARRLRTDPTLNVDSCGDLLYIEPAALAQPAAAAQDTGSVMSEAPDPGSAFALHSNPDATRTLYLDFDGEYLDAATNAWADRLDVSWQVKPFDADGSESTFGTTERLTVVSIWQRVAEDYAPFDVDVTTEDPGPAALQREDAGDVSYGTRILITNDTVVYDGVCGSLCGGVAFLGTFGDSSHDPAWVFTAGVGTQAKPLAEAASHEAGHILGLHHDGLSGGPSYYLGHRSLWAPIMGVGYYTPVTQWSAGEYTNANNSEDDIAVITSAGNGVTFRADEAPSGSVSAPTVTPGTPVSGFITSRADADTWQFTTDSSGSVSITATPAPVSPNLDIALTVRDEAGAQLGTVIDPPAIGSTNDRATGLDAAVTLTVPSGRYFVTVDGTGVGTGSTGYTEYASVGAYTLTVIGSPPEPVTVTTAALPGGTVGQPYSASLTASGGTGPYAWAVPSGGLPPGTVLSEAGTLTGTPTAAGWFPVTVTVTDSRNVTGSARVGVNVVPIASPPAAPGPTVPVTTATVAAVPPDASGPTSTQAPAAGQSLAVAPVIKARTRVGKPLSFRLTVLGSAGPCTWTKTGGTATWARVHAAGKVTGRTARPGRYTVTLAVTDADGRAATTILKVRVTRR